MPSLISSEPDQQITSNKLIWWLLSIIASIVVLGGSAFATTIVSQISELQKHQAVVDVQVAATNGKLDLILYELKQIEMQSQNVMLGGRSPRKP